MRVRDALLTGLIALFGGAGAYVLLRLSPRESGEAHSADGHAQDSGAKGGSRRGLHGGRLLADGDIEVELAIFERGVPPRFRLWACWRGQPQAPESLKAALSIQRLGLPA
jgi:cobalt-zinc-cadmium efflux system membrane fusion protein